MTAPKPREEEVERVASGLTKGAQRYLLERIGDVGEIAECQARGLVGDYQRDEGGFLFFSITDLGRAVAQHLAEKSHEA